MTAAALLLVLARPAPAPVTFADVVTAARDDARALPPGAGPHTRYLSLAHLPAADRKELAAVLGYHANGLSRGAKVRPPRPVNGWLLAVDLRDYHWDPKTWEDLRKVNHYFCLKVETVTAADRVEKKWWPAGVENGRPYAAGYYDTTVKAGKAVDFIPAPWLPPLVTAELVALTGSATPIVRGDEFLFQTFANGGRVAGYYRFLGLAKRADAEQLARLDRKGAEAAFRELAAIVPVSGVGLNNRQVFRYATIGGAWWETRDPLANTGEKNGVVNLLDDFKHDAEEIVFTLPNGLPAYYLSDAKGNQVATVPDGIAADHRSTNNDRRIDAFSCAVCHTDGGLRPIRDYARRLYSGANGLSLATLAADAAKAERLESVYLGPLDRAYKRDAADFAEAIKAACGLAPAELSKAVERQWSRYLDEPVTPARAAAECGVTPDQLRDAVRRAVKARGVANPVVAVLVLDDEDAATVRREHLEEVFGVLMLILQGANP